MTAIVFAAARSGSAAYGGTSQYWKGQAGDDQAFSACISGRGYTTGK